MQRRVVRQNRLAPATAYTGWSTRSRPPQSRSLITAAAPLRPNTSPPSTRARARARDGSGNQKPWPADKVERWAIDRLIPYAKNARTHAPAQIAAIAASIKEWGWTTPTLVGEASRRILRQPRCALCTLSVRTPAGKVPSPSGRISLAHPGGTSAGPLGRRPARRPGGSSAGCAAWSSRLERHSSRPEAKSLARSARATTFEGE
jgi:hypothetical protein